MSVTPEQQKKPDGLVRDIDPNVRQRRASNPASSIWVGASAGTGKTKVLTDRVLRLLLPADEHRAGTPAHKILGLTFTKAAASEMALRINETLASWAIMSADDLQAALKNLLGRMPETFETSAARRLFADVIDDGTGLQIMTIHSFCQSVLGRFPLEAGLNPYFTVLEDHESAEMLKAAQAATLSNNAKNQPLNDAIDRLVCYLNEDQFSQLIGDIIKERGQLSHVMEKNFGADGLHENLCAMLDIPSGMSAEALRRDACAAINQTAMRDAAKIIGTSDKKTDQEKANALIDFLTLAPIDQQEQFHAYCHIFLTKDFAPRKTQVTANVKKSAPHIQEIMEQEAERLEEAIEQERKIQCARLTADLMRLGQEIIARYGEMKAGKGTLDFDDLIMKTAALLDHADMRSWVNFKLDQGLDHILVDEAQDTNPQQWAIIRALSEEFFAGIAARDEVNRTLFVVGDEKQSIYSFQRASPKSFNEMREFFGRRITEAEEKWDEVGLNISFRSTAPILGLVDSVVNQTQLYGHAAQTMIEHKSFRTGQGGLCTLWPIFEHEESEKSDLWDPPIAIEETTSGAAKMAEHIASEIKGWLDNDEQLEGYSRAITPGDIMILMRTRNAFVGQLTQALKKYNIPISGNDRMVLSQQLVVQDLLILAEFALLPSDDLTLATLLKSPLIGLSEDDLFTLCHEREGTLWARVQSERGDIARYLSPWISRAQSMRPFEFFNLALHSPCPADSHSGMRGLISRLGGDIRDPIEAFLGEALSFEGVHIAALQYFVQDQKQSTSSIKREMDAGAGDDGGEVRIMTIHGSKGLQAPIVILPDTFRTTRTPPAKADMRLFWPLESGLDLPLYAPDKKTEPALYKRAKQDVETRMDEEYRRLLYVAMTRAEERLYVGGYRGKKNPLADSWYFDIARGFDGLADSEYMSEREDGTRTYRMSRVKDPDKAKTRAQTETITAPDLPRWAFETAAPEETAARSIAPSRLLDDSALPASSPYESKNEYRFLRGNITHKLLEFLPDLTPAHRRDAAQHYVVRYGDQLPKAIQAQLINEVFAILEDPDFAAIFGENSRAEVSIGGSIGGAQTINGQIDRLLVRDDKVLILDYKTNRPPPQTAAQIPAIYLRQMRSYHQAMTRIYPSHTVECALLWTDGPNLMIIPDKLLTQER